ncbi:FAD-dependent oxidoreductase [Candidatus Roizmanbacteria bacterium]|nr:FAD-dependent oxidoreductase [Candidatus Roizmanbacteria bacterium]
MRIAILGGGFTGMAAAYYLAKKGYDVTLFEKEKVLGGLAVGFRQPNWDWYLERAYHHLLDSEDDILNFAKDMGFEDIFFKNTQTSSLYDFHPQGVAKNGLAHPEGVSDYRIFPVDTPHDFLRFPLLSFPEKIRAGIILAFLKSSPFLTLYEKQTAQEFLKKTMGERVWEVLWQELFRKKFGKYAENILASFIWARIKKRAKNLGYVKGGFQTFINYLEKQLKSLWVKVSTGYEIKRIEKGNNEYRINNIEKFDAVVSTLPTVIMSKITQSIFSQSFLNRFSKLKYLHAVVLILQTKQPILDKTYWLNICAPKIPIMIIAQHTNFIDKKHYGGNNMAYVGWYVDRDDPLIKMDSKEVLNFCLPHLKKITDNRLLITDYFLFHGPFAQPIFDKDFLKNKPDFITPVKNFYIANLDMTYPYDRGTNYAVKLGKDVARLL